MAKNIIKEIIIFLLLLLVVGLVMGIVFYDYIPTAKTVPSKVVPYKLSEEVDSELKSATSEERNIVKTYSIDKTDLRIYEATADYDKGKINPFEKQVAVEEPSGEENTNTNTSSNGASNNNTQNGTNSVGNFFEEEGK